MRLAVKRAVLAFSFIVVGGCSQKEKGESTSVGSSGDPRLDGTYTFVASEMHGKLVKEAESERIYTIAGDKMIPPKGKLEDATTIKCDPTKNPSEIDLSRTESDGKVDTYHGIYKLEGDTLTLCIRKSNNPADRPSDFKTDGDSRDIIQVLKRPK